MAEDRKCFRAYMKERAEDGNPFASSFYKVLSRDDEVERHWWFNALSYRNIHEAMFECNWAPNIQHR